MIYENGNDFLCGRIEEDALVMKKKFVDDADYIYKWWKRHAISRYSKLYDEGRLKPECLYYVDGIGMSWEDFKEQRISEVGR
jgi:hypothetical protein